MPVSLPQSLDHIESKELATLAKARKKYDKIEKDADEAEVMYVKAKKADNVTLGKVEKLRDAWEKKSRVSCRKTHTVLPRSVPSLWVGEGLPMLLACVVVVFCFFWCVWGGGFECMLTVTTTTTTTTTTTPSLSLSPPALRRCRTAAISLCHAGAGY